MKIYSFQCIMYGEEYHVLAENSQNALDFLKKFLEVPEDSRYTKNYKGDEINTYEYDLYLDWENATIENLPEDYAIAIHSVGEVIKTEVS